MKAIAQVLRLRPGCYDEYKRRHDQLWPELAALFSTHGIRMRIFVFEDLLFAYATAPVEATWEMLARHPLTQRWDQYMADILETDANGAPWVVDLPMVFEFGEP